MSDTNDSCAISRANNRRFRGKVPKQWLSFAGDCAPIRDYLASRSFDSYWAPFKFLDALFRGYGQVVFANNPISGILIFMALTVADPLVSAAGLLTASVGLLVSIVILPQPSEVLGQGITVFNSLLIGLITTATLPTRYDLDLETWHWFSMIIASIMSVYVESAFSNILGSLCRFPLPYLTVPFNVVQPLLFLTLININTLATNNTTSVTTHHTMSQPPPLVPSSLIIIDRLNQVSEATTQPPLVFFPNSLKETSSAGVLIHGFSTHRNTFVGEDPEDQLVHTLTNFQHITVKPSKNLYFEHKKYSRTTSEGTFEGATESGKDLNLKNGSRLAVNEFESVESLTSGAYNFRGKETSVTNTVPEHEQSAPTEFLLNAGNSHLQPHSVDSTVELLHDRHNYTVEEDHVAGFHLSTATSVMESSTSEISPLHSTDTASNFDEENIPVDEDTATRRVKRSVPLEATLRNSFLPHKNASFDVVEPIVDWGGVFSGVVLSMSQVYGISQAPTAILIYLAVIIYSPITAALALLGATLGTLTGLLLTDIDTYAIAGGVYDGTWGFNGLLSAMCLGGLFFVLNWPATVAAVLCSFLSTLIMHVLIPPFAQAGLSPVSLPFNLAALLFLCVTSSGSLVRPDAVSFPEKHRQEYRHLHLKEAQEESLSTSDINDKDEEMEKKELSEIKVV